MRVDAMNRLCCPDDQGGRTEVEVQLAMATGAGEPAAVATRTHR